jgi:2-amino-4-hydroxy-6-hydroxymethyldihydropteridine diphosphokinase
MSLAYVGLGSNLEQPLQQVTQALHELDQIPGTRLLKSSRLYQSQAIGPDQPDFINAAALLETQLTPILLLDELQKIEQLHQRRREQHWGPRTLDLDMLLFDQIQIQSTRLTLPHAFLTERAFVLLPLLDLDTDLRLPDGTLVQSCLVHCQSQKIQALPESIWR